MDYQSLTDEELILRSRAADAQECAEITDYLLAKFKPLVRSMSNEFFIIGGDSDDLIQEGMIGLFKAIRDYDVQREASFSTFANLCVRRQIYSAMEASNRKKHTPLNSYISLFSDDEEEKNSLEEHLFDETTVSPEQLVIEQEFWEEFYQELWKRLSKLEREVLSLYREGRSYTEIAAIMNKDPKAIDNALQRIRKKVSLWNFQESEHAPSGA